MGIIQSILLFLRAFIMGRAAAVENLALRQQVAVTGSSSSLVTRLQPLPSRTTGADGVISTIAQPAYSSPAAGSAAIANPGAQQILSPKRIAVTCDRDDCIQPLLFEKMALQPPIYTGQSKPTFRTRLSHRVVTIRVSRPSRSWPPMPAVARSGREHDREPCRLARPVPSPPSSPSRADRPSADRGILGRPGRARE